MTQEKSLAREIDPQSRDSEPLIVTAAKRRAELAKDYLTEAGILVRLGIDHKTLVTWRKARKILAVWHSPENRYLYPSYQFNNVGVIPEMEPLLQHLFEHSNGSGWNEVEWLMTPHALLDGMSPTELLPIDPAKVLEAAEVEFVEERDAGW